MNVSIEKKDSFQILAVSREFDEKTCFAEIPKFWNEYYAQGNGHIACGQYGICYGGDGKGKFRYGIGNECKVEKCADGSNVYHIFNCHDLPKIPEGFELLTVPAVTWAATECFGALPHSIQDMWPRVYKEWLPNSGYEKAFCFDIEEYGYCEHPEDSQKPDYRCVIRIPVMKSRADKIETERLRILPLTPTLMQKLLAGTPQLEAALGLAPSGLELDKHTHEAMAYLADLAQKTPDSYPWITNWQIIWKERNISVGSACFMNKPDADGNLEIGYGIYPSFQNRGFMTEALKAIITWAMRHPAVRIISAETDFENITSHRVLEKSGFRTADGCHFFFNREKPCSVF